MPELETKTAKPWEETWTASGTTLLCERDPITYEQTYFEDPARAKLAAQAPAMARLVLEAMRPDLRFPEWGCPFCELDASLGHDLACPGSIALRGAGLIE